MRARCFALTPLTAIPMLVLILTWQLLDSTCRAEDTSQLTNKARLDSLSLVFRQQLEARRTPRYYDLLCSDDLPQRRLNENADTQPRQIIHEVTANGEFERIASEYVGPAFQIGTGPIYYCGAASGQAYTAIAFGGTNHLVVWTDWRIGTGDSDIYGARVSLNGVLLDSTGIRISTADNSVKYPAVAFDGNNYFVVWHDTQEGSFSNIYGARIGLDGTVLDPSGIAITASETSQRHPTIAFDGVNYLVVWAEYRPGTGTFIDIFGTRVTVDGDVLDPAGIAISTAAHDQKLPAVVFGGSSYLVVWQDLRSGSEDDIYGARVGTDGIVLDSSGIEISTAANSQYYPSVASDGEGYLVVWTDYRSGTEYDIYGTRVSMSGSVLDSSGIAISTAPSTQQGPAVAFAETTYLVLWEDYRSGTSGDIYAARVATDGSVLDPSGIAVSTAIDRQRYPVAAFDGTNYLVAWEDSRTGGSGDLYGTRLSVDGAVLDSSDIIISTSANTQDLPAAAFDGTNYLVVWSDYCTTTERDIYGARLSTDGTVLDPSAIVISTAADSHGEPAIAFGGTNYLVVWDAAYSGKRRVYGSRVSTDGDVLDPSGIPLCAADYGQTSPSVGFDGTNYLVVWEDGRNVYISGSDIYGARVSVDGTVLDSYGIPVCTAEDSQEDPVLAFDGTNYFVVWYDHRSGSGDIYGARLTLDGSVLDPSGIPVSAADKEQADPTVAFDGTNYLAVWEDHRPGTSSDIYGARVGMDGSVLDSSGIAISTVSATEQRPVVVFDGTSHVLAWERYLPIGDYDTHCIRVSPDGTLPDSIATVISSARGRQTGLTLCTGILDQILVAYSSFAESPGYGSYRIWGNFLGEAISGQHWYESTNSLKPRLETMHPNPFGRVVNIVYTIPSRGFSSLRIYDILGRRVVTLEEGVKDPGRYTISWNGEDSAGESVAQGIYFCLVEATGYADTKKLIILR